MLDISRSLEKDIFYSLLAGDCSNINLQNNTILVKYQSHVKQDLSYKYSKDLSTYEIRK